ncbi:MAG: hypothetical protein QM699_16705 [Amaricoccus sp.]|uniref:hypothetical protein n=1 Tax=Amaricoccus sp. TaxID=1872485 RepID=UPI0039E59B96
MKLRHAIASGLLALALAGCAEISGPRSNNTASTMVTTEATVVSVDQATRHVVLRGEDGTTTQVAAGPEVRNLGQLKAGDTVRMDYFRATTVSMADPADTGEVQKAAIAGRAPEGGKPGAMAATNTSMVVTVVNFDSNNGIATFRTPDGMTRQAVVPPELRGFASRRGAGSRVLVSMTEAVAVTIAPEAKG